jgi:hypothetical protein
VTPGELGCAILGRDLGHDYVQGHVQQQLVSARRRVHRLGIIVAAIVMAIGFAIIAAAVVRLERWEALHEDSLAIVLSMALVPLATSASPCTAWSAL